MKNSIQICLIEDSVIVRDLLAFTLENNMECTVHSLTMVNIMTQIVNINPDVIILDYALDCDHTSINSMQLLEEIDANLPHTPTIIFSGQTSLSVATKMIQKGAVDYVSKNSKTFHEDIILSVRISIKLRSLAEMRKKEKKERNNQITKILSLSIIIGLLLGFMLFQ